MPASCHRGWDKYGGRFKKLKKMWIKCCHSGADLQFWRIGPNVSHKPLVTSPVKALLPHLAAFLMLASAFPAETCREVVRDSSGRIVQTIDRRKQKGGTVQATTRDASGRIIGTATTRPNSGGGARTEYRDASGRLTGFATTQPASGGSSRTIFRDASGRLAGSADTRTTSGSTSSTQYRDASGRLTGTRTTHNSRTGSFTGTERDASGRLTGGSSGSGKCQNTPIAPLPPPKAKR
jgi:hypothetical protein